MKKEQTEITAESLKNYPGFENLTDQQAEETARDLRILTRAIFKQMIRTQAFFPESKAA